MADAGIPALAIALVWGPNDVFLSAFMKGALHLPRSLEPVHPIEPMLYRWLGVGLVKRLVATRLWPMLMGVEPPQKLTNRCEFSVCTELSTKGAEICHGATFLLSFAVVLFCLAVGQASAGVWILLINVALNG